MTPRGFVLRSWDWVHPSHRDLVIDRLSENPEMALQYLRKGGLPAIALALSESGGSAGQRRFPLLRHNGSWQILSDACIAEISRPKTTHASRVLTILEGASSSSVEPQIAQLIATVCTSAKRYWDNDEVILPASLVRKFVILSDRCGSYIPSPLLLKSWLVSCSAMQEGATQSERDPSEFKTDELAEWISMVSVVKSMEPRLIPKGALKCRFDSSVVSYIAAAKEALREEIDEDEDAETFASQEKRFEELSAILGSLEKIFPDRAAEIKELSQRLSDHAEYLAEEASRRSYEPEEDEPVERYRSAQSSGAEVSVEKIFEDL